MNNQATTSDFSRMSYAGFIWRLRANRQLLGASLGVSAALFGILKIFYPYPDFFGDSYSYIYAAASHLDINIWPIGYSKFLELFHSITPSATALVAFQYFTLQLAAIHFLFTMVYFYNLTPRSRNILFLFFVVNPLTLYLCNTINSDALFATVTLLWITELIWVIHRPRRYRVATSAALLFVAFTIRNNAYYYPLAGALAFLLCQQSRGYKVAGVALPVLLIIPFVLFTRDAAYKLTGTRQFSLFTGWQLANNVLYMYDQIEVDSMDLPTADTRELNRYALQYFRRINPETYRPVLEDYVGNFFIRQPEAPLKQYYASQYSFKEKDANIINWAKASQVFEQFGKALLEQHPTAYLRYFMLPNIKHYLIPPLSHIEIYNYGLNEIDPEAQKWFHYQSTAVRVASPTFQGKLLLLYTGLFLLLNVYYIGNILRWAFGNTGRAWKEPGVGTHFFILAYQVLNFSFSVTATVNILRYQYVPMLILAGFGITLGHCLKNQTTIAKTKPRSQHQKYGITEPNTF